MPASLPTSEYALGNTDAEHDRLIWQAERANPLTERLFREAGIGYGQRVLDIGSGVGDVAILAARLVGPSGEVVGIERDPRSLARARARVAAAGLLNVSFQQSDVSQVPAMNSFDAAVGRFILMFLPDPVAALRSVSKLVRPGGVVVFQEPYWVPVRALLSPLPLWSAAVSLIHETFVRSGANPEMGSALYAAFQEAGLPAPTVRLEVPMGKDPDFAQWFYVTICTLRPQIQQVGLSTASVGDLDTLAERLQAEVSASNTLASWLPAVGAWSRKSAS
jgi:ubiquinone/menaquinone biosynthesis C-methylase UbiE